MGNVARNIDTPIRVGIVEQDDCLFHRNLACKYESYSIFLSIAKTLHASLNITSYDKWRTYPPDNGTSIINAIANGEIDTYIGSMPLEPGFKGFRQIFAYPYRFEIPITAYMRRRESSVTGLLDHLIFKEFFTQAPRLLVPLIVTLILLSIFMILGRFFKLGSRMLKRAYFASKIVLKCLPLITTVYFITEATLYLKLGSEQLPFHSVQLLKTLALSGSLRIVLQTEHPTFYDQKFLHLNTSVVQFETLRKACTVVAKKPDHVILHTKGNMRAFCNWRDFCALEAIQLSDIPVSMYAYIFSQNSSWVSKFSYLVHQGIMANDILRLKRKWPEGDSDLCKGYVGEDPDYNVRERALRQILRVGWPYFTGIVVAVAALLWEKILSCVLELFSIPILIYHI